MHKSIQHHNFLSPDEASHFLDCYYNMRDHVAEYLGWVPKQSKMIEFQTLWDPVKGLKTVIAAMKLRDVGSSFTKLNWSDPKFKEFIEDTKEHWSFMYDIREMIGGRFPALGRESGFIHATTIHNLVKQFEVHTDGQDVEARRETVKPEDGWDKLPREQWEPREPWKFTHQGLISLFSSDPYNGTVVFDQQFPYSVYLDFSRTDAKVITGDNNKHVIMFCKGDSIKRFDTEIKNFTHADISDEDYARIMKGIPKENYWLFPKERCYGLSVNEVLYFDKPGTLISWDTDRFHRPLPFENTWKENRINIQYECHNV